MVGVSAEQPHKAEPLLCQLQHKRSVCLGAAEPEGFWLAHPTDRAVSHGVLQGWGVRLAQPPRAARAVLKEGRDGAGGWEGAASPVGLLSSVCPQVPGQVC